MVDLRGSDEMCIRDSPYTDCVCTVDDLFYDIVPGEDFHVNEIDLSLIHI